MTDHSDKFYGEDCDDMLNLFQKAVDSGVRSSFNPMPSNNNFAEDVQKTFYSSTVYRAVEYGYSGGGRYTFYLFRSKDGNIYHIWTHNGTFNVCSA